MTSEEADVDRRAPALVALLLFVVLTGAAIVVSGSRPAGDGQGDLPALIQVAGYVAAAVGGALLLKGPDPAARRTGVVVLGVIAVLALVDWLTAGQEGADIGAGLARLVGLVVLAVVITRLSVAVSAARRSAS
ncbi:hypothetical protein DQ244_07115 [Blastococcus sp. TBT05-19]|uniref:hypothetical protein n=1 Tax=Blastococcus sp. TBT05-19 TaxID=2250581 RepID=UPI000DEB5791|nr:hypothetical protein [Blastococcus sp. TBT05-19]RBY92074.1 hypothetical protein DQ244_07115 [Blastococcus sp. TBT05-19]